MPDTTQTADPGQMALSHIAAVTGQAADALTLAADTHLVSDGRRLHRVELGDADGLRRHVWLVQVGPSGTVRGVLHRLLDAAGFEHGLWEMLHDYESGNRTSYGITAPVAPDGPQRSLLGEYLDSVQRHRDNGYRGPREMF